jgi:hypothetical protein
MNITPNIKPQTKNPSMFSLKGFVRIIINLTKSLYHVKVSVLPRPFWES